MSSTSSRVRNILYTAETGTQHGRVHIAEMHLHLQVRDAGRTEVAAGSVTVAAIGGQSEKIDQITGRLKTF